MLFVLHAHLDQLCSVSITQKGFTWCYKYNDIIKYDLLYYYKIKNMI